ncbi:hypothetical protein V6N13_105701 [Hibiscus sabdariffa]|uniref:Uncharacterized protein n=1 Tax=Hibiscus sabdariffa TaxID=183260 RepID=A0ABR2EYG9_9ROSI
MSGRFQRIKNSLPALTEKAKQQNRGIEKLTVTDSTEKRRKETNPPRQSSFKKQDPNNNNNTGKNGSGNGIGSWLWNVIEGVTTSISFRHSDSSDDDD